MNYEMRNSLKVFIDFDGTITQTDIGENMFLRFGDKVAAYSIINRWIDKEISSTESWKLLCNTINNFDQKVFDDFIDEIQIDPFFKCFYDFCIKNKIEIFVLSDGLDYYIKKFFMNNGLDEIKFFSNLFSLGADKKITPLFPYLDEECLICANCKRNHIIENSSDTDITIYIGDGYSDTCPSQFVDYLFAKKSLLKFCESNRISYFPFNNFNDVQKIMAQLITKKRIKKRHHAVLKRKEVYLRG